MNKKINSKVTSSDGTSKEYKNPTPGQITIVCNGKSFYREVPTGDPKPVSCGEDPYGEFSCQFYTDSMMQDIKDSKCNATFGLLGPWNGQNVNPWGLSEEILKEPFPYIRASLQAAKNAGMKLFISIGVPSNTTNYCNAPENHFDNNAWENNLRRWGLLAYEFVKKEEFESLGGWFICDEPCYAVFDRLRAIKEEIRKYDTKHPIIVNLFPKIDDIEEFNGSFRTYVTTASGEVKAVDTRMDVIHSYDDYLNKFQEIFEPEVWCYDFYPVRTTTLNPDVLQASVNPQFYYQLETFSKMGKTTQRPFWSYCDVMEVKFYNEAGNCTGILPSPTVGLLCLEAFAPLCYGAQGILYWAMYLRRSQYKLIKDDTTQTESCVLMQEYVSAPFDLYGEPDRINFMVVEEVNSKIMKCSHVFSGGRMLDVQYYGREGLPEECKNLSRGFADIMSISRGGIGFLVSYLRNGEKYYTILLNRDFANSQKTTVIFSKKKRNITPYQTSPIHPIGKSDSPQKVSGNDGVVIDPNEGTSFTIDIKPGDMIIFEWIE